MNRWARLGVASIGGMLSGAGAGLILAASGTTGVKYGPAIGFGALIGGVVGASTSGVHEAANYFAERASA